MDPLIPINGPRLYPRTFVEADVIIKYDGEPRFHVGKNLYGPYNKFWEYNCVVPIMCFESKSVDAGIFNL